MSIYQRCDESVLAMANAILHQYPEHTPLLEQKVKIDFVFAYAPTDENGKPVGVALKKNGVRAYGIARKISPKDRAMGRGDAEIALDGDWWGNANPEEQKALLDHELYHLSVQEGKRDDMGRPVLRLRKHDYEFGWFTAIAKRHGPHSLERQQAKMLVDDAGQFFWPQLMAVCEQPISSPIRMVGAAS